MIVVVRVLLLAAAIAAMAAFEWYAYTEHGVMPYDDWGIAGRP